MPTLGSGFSENPVDSALPSGTKAYRSLRSLFSTSDRTSSAGKSGLSRPGIRVASTVVPLALLVGTVKGSVATIGLGLTAGWAPRVLRGIDPNKVRTLARVACGSRLPTTTRMALLGAYHLP